MDLPRTMNFWWGGGPMSWLRQQTLTTFRRHHPDWEMTLHLDVASCGPRDGPWAPGVKRLTVAAARCPVEVAALGGTPAPWDLRCDVFRWAWLAEHGGWFSDLDVLYLASIDTTIDVPIGVSLLVTCDGGTCDLHDPRKAYAIGLMGGRAGSALTLALAAYATDRARSTGGTHQKCGTEMLAGHLAPLRRRTKARVDNIWARLLYPHGFLAADNRRLWTEDVPLPDGLLGLHWGGGHARSQLCEDEVDADWCRTEQNMIARAWCSGTIAT